MYNTASRLIQFTILLTLPFIVSSFSKGLGKESYKCMVQMKNYYGEGAYIIVSVLDKDDNYIKTLQVLGKDNEWYPDLKKWYSFRKNEQDNELNGMTGATVAGGQRSVFSLKIKQKYLTGEYKLRFESAVESQKYVLNDVLIPLDSKNITGKHEGSEYIRYVKIKQER